MTREQIIDQFVKDPEYRKIAEDVAGHLGDDLYQDLTLAILEMPEHRLIQIGTTCMKCFFYRMARNQYNSVTSTFHRRYRKDFYEARKHLADIQQASQSTAPSAELCQKVDRAMKEVHWYDAGVLSLYVEKGTVKAVSEATQIPAAALHETIARTKKVIKKKIKRYE